jgi:hypothetical protein
MLNRDVPYYFRGTCSECAGVVTEILIPGLDEDEDRLPPRVSRCSDDGTAVTLELVRCERPGCAEWANDFGAGGQLVCRAHVS